MNLILLGSEILLYALYFSFLMSLHNSLQDSERAAVVAAEEKIRGLESQLQEERNTSVNAFNVSIRSILKIRCQRFGKLLSS